MPGICGIIRKVSDPKDALRLEVMIRQMAHFPDCVVGTHTDAALGASVGWLAYAGSAAAEMPFWNSTRDLCLIMSGELFSGESSNSNCGPLLLERYERLGPAFLRELNGWFSGVLLDLRSRRILLFNDRYGMGRVYVYEDDSTLYFASEAKGLLGVLPQLRRLDPRGVAEWLSCGCALEDRTLFANLSTLPVASSWIASPLNSLQKGRYFEPRDWENQLPLQPQEYYEGLRERFSAILPSYLAGRLPLGISLTGGVDSRLIMAWRNGSAKVPCYSFGGPFRDCWDVRIGQQVAQACGCSHQVIRVSDHFLREFPTLAAKASFVSDGTMDASGAVEVYVNRIAREVAPVRVTGNYGGEILRRMVAFGPRAISSVPFAPEIVKRLALAVATYQENRAGHPLSFIAFKQVPWHHYSRLSVEQSQVIVRSPYLDNELVSHVFRAPPDSMSNKSLMLRLIRDGDVSLHDIPTDRGLRVGHGGIRNDLRKRWNDFTAKAEYAFDYGMPQWLASLDRLLDPLQVDRLFLGRHKFYHFRRWYSHELKDFVQDVLLSRPALEREIFEPSGLRQIVSRHVQGSRNYTVELNKLLALELVQRELTDIRNDARLEGSNA